jgi:DNA-binding transcriptional LysR family regulator
MPRKSDIQKPLSARAVLADGLGKLSRNAFQTVMTVVETGSIRKAAETMGLAQSAVSRQILAVEEELAVRLFERLPNGVALTPEGEIFMRHARENRAQLERVRAEISTLQGLRNAVIRVAIVESFAHHLLPAAIGAFREKHPSISYQSFVAVTGSVVKAVRDGVADFGIAFNLSYERDLKIRYSARDPTLAVMRPSHPFAKRVSLGLTDLVGVPLALPSRDTPIGSDISEAARSLGVPLRSILYTPSMPLLLEAACRADVISIIPQSSAVAAIRDGSAVAVPLREKIFDGRRIDIFTVASWPLSRASEAFVHFIERQLDSPRA